MTSSLDVNINGSIDQTLLGDDVMTTIPRSGVRVWDAMFYVRFLYPLTRRILKLDIKTKVTDAL
jgi:hypothetical protein